MLTQSVSHAVGISSDVIVVTEVVIYVRVKCLVMVLVTKVADEIGSNGVGDEGAWRRCRGVLAASVGVEMPEGVRGLGSVEGPQEQTMQVVTCTKDLCLWCVCTEVLVVAPSEIHSQTSISGHTVVWTANGVVAVTIEDGNQTV